MASVKSYKSSAWQEIDTMKTYKSSAWQEADHAKALVSSAWQEVWGSGYEFVQGDDMKYYPSAVYTPKDTYMYFVATFQRTSQYEGDYHNVTVKCESVNIPAGTPIKVAAQFSSGSGSGQLSISAYAYYGLNYSSWDANCFCGQLLPNASSGSFSGTIAAQSKVVQKIIIELSGSGSTVKGNLTVTINGKKCKFV